MINDIKELYRYFDEIITEQEKFQRFVLKEYLECLALDYISKHKYGNKLVFIGGTSLRLIYNIDRFSEDLDFDNKGLTYDEFITLTDDVVKYINKNGFIAFTNEKESDNIKAYRRTVNYPELLFTLKLSPNRNEKLKMKIETQDQGLEYKTEIKFVQRCGFAFPIKVPTIDTLCSMKVNTVLERSKGRDFYDLLFLLQMTEPNYDILTKKYEIHNYSELKDRLFNLFESVDIENKSNDMLHLLIDEKNRERIINFKRYLYETKKN